MVPERKITHYLLNRDHPEGGSKARYFLGLGYDLDTRERFRNDLLLLGRTSEMEKVSTRFGSKYVGVASVTPPRDGPVQVKTIWILRGDSPPPVLVTAYPA